MSAPETAADRPRLALGLGCDRGTPVETLAAAVREALSRLGATEADVVAAASIDLKADEPGLHALAKRHGWPLRFHTAARLASVPVPNPSETVRRHTGTPSVSEAAALLAAGENARAGAGAGADVPADRQALLVEKHKHRGPDGRHATVSIARVARRAGGSDDAQAAAPATPRGAPAPAERSIVHCPALAAPCGDGLPDATPTPSRTPPFSPGCP